MNCANHNEVTASAYCRTCGKPMCATCARNVQGVIYCEECLAARLHTLPGAQPAARPSKPGIAAVLGLIPGVGAMYNGQFMKGFIHLISFVVIIWISDHVGPATIPLYFAFFFYLVFDAYKTAQALELGLPLPDPLGLARIFGDEVVQPTAGWQAPTTPPGNPATGVAPAGAPASPAQQQTWEAQRLAEDGARQQRAGHTPFWAVVLILLGVLFLFDNLGWLEFNPDRYIPLIMIVTGAWWFYRRWTCNRVS